jgi:hypothetical protein
MWLLRHYPATQMSSFTFLTPVFALVFGVVLLNEPLTLQLCWRWPAWRSGIVLGHHAGAGLVPAPCPPFAGDARPNAIATRTGQSELLAGAAVGREAHAFVNSLMSPLQPACCSGRARHRRRRRRGAGRGAGGPGCAPSLGLDTFARGGAGDLLTRIAINQALSQQRNAAAASCCGGRGSRSARRATCLRSLIWQGRLRGVGRTGCGVACELRGNVLEHAHMTCCPPLLSPLSGVFISAARGRRPGRGRPRAGGSSCTEDVVKTALPALRGAMLRAQLQDDPEAHRAPTCARDFDRPGALRRKMGGWRARAHLRTAGVLRDH